MNKGILALIMSYFIGGSIVPTAVKLGVGELPPIFFVAFRFTIATLVLLPLILHLKRKISLEQIKKNFFYYLLFGANATLFTIGIQYTTTLISQLIYTLTPLIVGLLGHFMLKEKLTSHKIIGSIIALSGVLFLISKSLENVNPNTIGTPFGNILVLAAVISWSFFLIFSKRHASKSGSISFTFGSFITSAAILLLLTPFEYISLQNTSEYHFSTIGIISIILVGTSSAVMFALMQYGIKKTEIFTASIFMYFGPFFTALTAIPILHEKITSHLLIGGALILCGVFYATTAKDFKKYISQYILKN